MRRTNQVKTLIAHQNPAAILMQLVGVYFNGQENGRPFLFSYGLQQPTRWTVSTQFAMTANCFKIFHRAYHISNERSHWFKVKWSFEIMGSNLLPFRKHSFLRLMPYPCSHFYFDINFGNRLYSNEKSPGSPFLVWIWSVTKFDIKVKVITWIGQ